MDERDNPVAGPTIITRMGDSWENMLNSYINKFPKNRWQLEKNLEALDTGFI